MERHDGGGKRSREKGENVLEGRGRREEEVNTWEENIHGPLTCKEVLPYLNYTSIPRGHVHNKMPGEGRMKTQDKRTKGEK